jgi:hypothetical protein
MTDFGLINLVQSTERISDRLTLQMSIDRTPLRPTKSRKTTQTLSTSIVPSIPSKSLAIAPPERAPRQESSRIPTPADTEISEITDETPVTAVSQLSDVRPTDWAFQALQSLVERYGCIAGYADRQTPLQNDRRYGGNRALSRYEFAAGLNACLNRVNELLSAATAHLVSQADLQTLQKLQEEFAVELAAVRDRVDALTARTDALEKQQFSTTTRLSGQAVVSLQGSNEVNVDLFPRDGIPERKGKLAPTLATNVQISLATSFKGNDLLLTGLQTGNLRSSAPTVFTNMGRLAYESELNNQLVLSDLSYRFPIRPNLGVIVGPAGVNASNTFRGINPLEGYGEGALSLFGQRNPIITIGNGTGGAGFDWQINRRISLQGVYSAELPGFVGNKEVSGLFGGRYTIGTQLSLAPTDTVDVGIHYLFSHSPDGIIGTGIGDAQLVSPFAPTNSAFNTHAIGATVAWRVSRGLTIGGWGGWTTSTALDISGSVQTTNWMLFSAFPDLFARGNLGGILFGQPPKITSSNLPTGYNFPRFSQNGEKGGQPDTAYHLEMFYRAQLNDAIDLTPGLLVVFNPNHNRANDTLVIGVVRATFRF